MGKRNQAESCNELGGRLTYALNKYNFGTLSAKQVGNTEGTEEEREGIRAEPRKD
jgi:hypothetical protein